MNISEFRQYARKWGKGKDPIKLLFPLDRLELLPANKKRKTHAVDHRSFMDSDGYPQYFTKSMKVAEEK